MAVSVDEIAALFREACPDLQLTDGDYGRPLADMGVDSLDKANALLEIQERFGVIVPDEDMDGLDSVVAVAEYVSAHLGPGA